MWPTEVRIVRGPRATSLASNTPSLATDVDVEIDSDDDAPPSPLTSISSRFSSPVSPARPLAHFPSPKPSPIELPRPRATMTTIPKTKPIIPTLVSAPLPSITTLPPLRDVTSISTPPLPSLWKGLRPPRRLDYLALYNPHLGTPLDFPPTEYFRWSQLRTSYSGPEPPHSASDADFGLRPTLLSSPTMYSLSAVRLDQSENQSNDAEETHSLSGSGPTTNPRRFSC